jgi:ACR3 family arsenite transporter
MVADLAPERQSTDRFGFQLRGPSRRAMAWETCVLSVVFAALPLVAGLWANLRHRTPEIVALFHDRGKPWIVMGFIATMMFLSGCRDQSKLDRPQIIMRIAMPIMVRSHDVFALAYAAA